MVVGKYAPLPARSLSELVSHLRQRRAAVGRRRGAPRWRAPKQRLPIGAGRRDRLVLAGGENPASTRHAAPDAVRLLAPFDPVVWDRRRFELLWGWAYRFEAYTPAPERVRGYYALPLLWRDQVIGWGNLALERDGRLQAELGYVDGQRAARARLPRRTGRRAGAGRGLPAAALSRPRGARPEGCAAAAARR